MLHLFPTHVYLKKKNGADVQRSSGTGSHMEVTQLGNSETLYLVFLGLNERASCPGLLANGCWHGYINALLVPDSGAVHTSSQSVIKTK